MPRPTKPTSSCLPPGHRTPGGRGDPVYRCRVGRRGPRTPGREPGAQVVAGVREAHPDILFLAVPSPRKEYFLARRQKDLGCALMVGVGGSFAVVAGLHSSAPRWMRAGLEWFHRLIQEPRRVGTTAHMGIGQTCRVRQLGRGARFPVRHRRSRCSIWTRAHGNTPCLTWHRRSHPLERSATELLSILDDEHARRRPRPGPPPYARAR
ncbi:WecB/TagA/CpsF family glycosyltransferase [Streptomyces sp900116325]|uniref:WecB/TagA/CpsF family glycosyltransferase n=1 Tax=Streptomyces sp. 900116325 TaxID=3154295 RepID=A0ABV2U653_9ACTN